MGKMARICGLAMDPNEQQQISQDDNRASQTLKVDKNRQPRENTSQYLK
jgi:hypothetical protein